MTLKNQNPNVIEAGQAATIVNAGGPRMAGWFAWSTTGWEVTLHKLSFDELARIAAAAREIVEGGK